MEFISLRRKITGGGGKMSVFDASDKPFEAVDFKSGIARHVAEERAAKKTRQKKLNNK